MLLCSKIYMFHRDNSIPDLLYLKRITSCFTIVKIAPPVWVASWETVDRRLSADTINGAVKGADLICELSLISLLCTGLSTTSGRKLLLVCTRFKCCTFYWPEEAAFVHAGENHMWRWQCNSFDLLLLSTRFPFLLFAGVISLYWVTRFPRVTEGTCCSPLDFFTSWTGRNFPWYTVKTASCHSHLPWNQEQEKVCSIIKVKGQVREGSW